MRAAVNLVLILAMALTLAACENMKRGIYDSSQQVERGKMEDAGIPSEPPPAPDYREYREYREKR